MLGIGPAYRRLPKREERHLGRVRRLPGNNAINLYFCAHAAFAKPEIYALLEPEGIGYAIRLPANRVLQERISPSADPACRAAAEQPQVFHASFRYQAQSWSKPRRVERLIHFGPENAERIGAPAQDH
jgi:hypothetical protein